MSNILGRDRRNSNESEEDENDQTEISLHITKRPEITTNTKCKRNEVGS